MVEIIKSSEYNARAIQDVDMDNGIEGYSFSYPVMNTIEICNLLIKGGSITIKSERMGTQDWFYDKETNILIIKDNKDEKKYYISDYKALGKAIQQYFNDNKEEILQKVLATNDKKSKSKLGNQNARKMENILSVNNASVINKITAIGNEYPLDFENHMDKIILAVKNNPYEFCELDEYIEKYHKSIGEYFYWLMGKGFVFKMSYQTKEKIMNIGYDVNLAERREQTVAERHTNFILSRK